MIGRLIDLAKTMREAERRGHELGLGELETTFHGSG
jgi:hypothetical protein